MKQLGLDLSAPTQPRTAPLRSFHVRSHITVPEAQEGERRAKKQEEAILDYFRALPYRHAPSDVATAFPQWPLTSIRRALTTMTAKGLLLHHPHDRRPGIYGSKESTWSLA